jgi:signal transduction histidine kinase
VLWLAGLLLLLRYTREKTFISYDEHEMIVDAERNETAHEREKQAVSAHEIRNPLNAIRGFAKMLLDDAADDDQRESAQVIVKETDRLDGILKRLLDYSRELKISLVEVPLPRWWDELKSIGGEMAHAATVKASWTAPPRATAVFDPDLMQQVFVNLFKNAVEASPRDGSIRAALSVRKNNIVLRIEDDGPGISPEDAAKAFEKYHTTKTEGSGVGLPFSKRIVKAHGGTIYFDHSVQKGAAIVVEWPVMPPKHVQAKARGNRNV